MRRHQQPEDAPAAAEAASGFEDLQPWEVAAVEATVAREQLVGLRFRIRKSATTRWRGPPLRRYTFQAAPAAAADASVLALKSTVSLAMAAAIAASVGNEAATSAQTTSHAINPPPASADRSAAWEGTQKVGSPENTSSKTLLSTAVITV
jgi:hypothetical protein